MDSEKFLSVDEKEIISLVNYHRNKYQDTKSRKGGLHPDDIQIMKLLDNAEEYVKEIVEERKKEKEQEPVQDAKEQLKNYAELLDFIKKQRNFPDAPDKIKKDIALLKREYKIFKRQCEEEEIAFQNMQLAKKNRDISTAALRDYLLGAKINNEWKHLKMGEG